MLLLLTEWCKTRTYIISRTGCSSSVSKKSLRNALIKVVYDSMLLFWAGFINLGQECKMKTWFCAQQEAVLKLPV